MRVGERRRKGSGATAATAVAERPYVFVSYRRDDVPDATDRLAAELFERFGRDHVFLDVDSIDPGADFVDTIGEWVARSDVLLVVIGRSWTSLTAADGSRRLDDPRDY